MTGAYGAIGRAADEKIPPPPAASDAVSSLASIASEGVKRDEESGRLLLASVDLREDKKKMSNGPESNEVGIFGAGSRRQDNTRLVTVFLVVNYMIGSGILNTPQTFRDSGLAATTVLYLVAGPAMWLGAVILIQAAEASSSGGGNGGSSLTTLDDLEYATLAKRTLGKHGPSIVDGSIVVQNFGAVCSYVILVGGLTTSMLAEGSEVAAWWQSFYVVTPVAVFLLVLPPCLVRHFSNLRWLAAFSLFAIAAVVCLVVVGSPSYAAAERLAADGETGLDAPLLWWNWMGAFAKMGSVVFAISFAAAALHSYSAMGCRTVKEWKAVVATSVLTGAILCYGTGLLGYLAFRDATQGDILDNFNGPLAACFKVLVVLHLIMYIPSETVILRHSLFALAGQDVMVLGFATVSSVTVGILAAIVGTVIALMLAGMAQGDLFGYVVDLTGGVTSSLTSFVIPAIAYLQATKGMVGQSNGDNVAAYRKWCWVLGVFGVAVMVMVPAAVVHSAISK